MEEGFFSEP